MKRRPSPARTWQRLLSAALLAGAAALAPALAAGCRETALPGECVGGIVIDGVCEGKCSPDLCAYDDNTCVGNRCVLQCDAHLDCLLDGTQVCAPAKEDDTGNDILICSPSGEEAGLGVPCPVGDECREGLECETKGEADATAYCTKRDCAADADCLPGYYCGVVRDRHEVCGSNPKKGDDALCGETDEPCAEPGAGGTTLFEGSACMLRRSCLKRGQGAPCASDVDCGWLEGQVCREAGGQKGCTHVCFGDSDCTPDAKCELPDGATTGACMPRFGAWIGGKGKFCEPCLNDEDCGSAGSPWACAELVSGMRGCFDTSYSTECATDADCPASPSGVHGTCLGDAQMLEPADPRYHRCYLPIDPVLGTLRCW